MVLALCIHETCQAAVRHCQTSALWDKANHKEKDRLMVLLIRYVNVFGVKNSECLELSISEVSWQILQFNLALVLLCVSLYYTFSKFRKEFQIGTFAFSKRAVYCFYHHYYLTDYYLKLLLILVAVIIFPSLSCLLWIMVLFELILHLVTVLILSHCCPSSQRNPSCIPLYVSPLRQIYDFWLHKINLKWNTLILIAFGKMKMTKLPILL